MDCIVLWVVKSQTRLSDFHFTLELDFQGGSVVVNSLPMQKMWVRSLGWEDLLEKEMATHSSTLAWKTPWTEEREERGGLQTMGSQRVGQD